jgi:RimJ/RimL family protein N-acetyltransferase
MTAFACETPGAAAPLGADLSALIPTLKTDRLTLRAPALSDFPVLVEIDQSVIGTGARERTRHDSWADFSMMSAIWLWHGHGWWAVDDTDGPCGFVGLGFEPGQKAAELGYILTPQARGKGYATEAATAARDYARDVARLTTLISYITVTNTASQNVATKLGATREDVPGEAKFHIWRHWGAYV